MVRQQQPTSTGVPVEVYAFINTAVWVDYEAIQSDVFDHILAIIPFFDLRLYQLPIGYTDGN
jgi:miniconductance mechanosensitive channel